MLPSIAYAEISIGLGAQTWPFMWKGNTALVNEIPLSNDEYTKWSVSESNLDLLKKIGAKWNFIDVWQEQDGPDNYIRINRAIHEHEKRGIKLVLRLLETPEIYDNLSDNYSSQYGYSKTYYLWIKSLVERFGSRVRALMISNEADHDIGYNRPVYKPFRRIEPSEYHKLLVTAEIAIKHSGGNIQFMDNGISSYTLCLAIMDDLYNTQGIDIALKFWKTMAYDSGSEKRNTFRLIRLLSSKNSKRRIDFVEQYFSQPAVYDYFQLHHYFGPESLKLVVEWVRKKLRETNSDKEIIVTEFGYRMPVKKGKTWDGRPRNVADWSRFSEEDQAEALVKSIVLFASLDVNEMLYWKSRFHNSRDSTGTLFESTTDANLFKPFKAAISYEYIVKTLFNRDLLEASSIPESLRNDDRLYVVSFTGNPSVSIIWPKLTGHGVDLSLPSDTISVYDIYGNPIKPKANNTITINASPVFLYWRNKKA